MNNEDNFTPQEQGIRVLVTLALREWRAGGTRERLQNRLDQISRSIVTGEVIECLKVGGTIAPCWGETVPARDPGVEG